MSPLILILSAAAFLLSAGINKYLIYFLRKKGMLDIPNQRSSHQIPTPRGGGIGILISVFACIMVYALYHHDTRLISIILAASAIGFTGWLDDYMKGLHTGLRFGIQLLCSAFIIWYLEPMEILPLPAPANMHLYYWSGFILSAIWIMGITNIFNFLDGIDGYAGMQGFIGGVVLMILFWGSPMAIAGIFISLACAGFLIFNWHPAKIFMGDVGSSFLGFLFAALPFCIPAESEISRTSAFFATAIFLWFFLLDGVFTIFRRLYKKEKIWQAHRSHLYQRLVISGLKHNEVVLTICFFYLILFTVLFFSFIESKSGILSWPLFATGMGLFLVYLLYTMYREKKYLKSTHQKKQ